MILCSLNGLQTIATVETMNFRFLCFIKILQPLLGLAKSRQNYSLYTISQNKSWRWSARLPQPITLIEWMKFKDFYESCSLSRWVLGQKPPGHNPPTNPQTKTPQDKTPGQKPPRVNFLFHVLKIFMVSQVHNLLTVQWLPEKPLVGWWFLKKPFASHTCNCHRGV